MTYWCHGDFVCIRCMTAKMHQMSAEGWLRKRVRACKSVDTVKRLNYKRIMDLDMIDFLDKPVRLFICSAL